MLALCQTVEPLAVGDGILCEGQGARSVKLMGCGEKQKHHPTQWGTAI